MEKYPYGYCGMPCALCSRFWIRGKSKCTGCSARGYYTDNCRTYRCCCERKLSHCALCASYPCEKLGKLSDFKDLNTNNAKTCTAKIICSQGFEVWYKDYTLRADMLTEAINNYNDGRMKRYLCELFIQRDIESLKDIIREARFLSGDAKQLAIGFKALVQEKEDSE